MRLIRYIRPTSRRSIDDQITATDRFKVHFTVVDGEDDRDFATALKILNKGNGLLIEGFHILGRRRDTVCERVKQIFAKGANIVDADGDIHPPSYEKTLIKALQARGVTVKGTEPRPRVAHNRIDDETRKEAKRLWTQKQFSRMTNADIAEEIGVSVVTLNQWFGPRGRRAGRPRAT
jgi:hypothetical protein